MIASFVIALPDFWKQLLLHFIPKIPRPVELPDFRGIALCSTLSKWYAVAVTIAAQEWLMFNKPPNWSRPLIFAYESDIGCESLTNALQLLLLKGQEWVQQTPVYLLSGGVLTAFDCVTPAAVAKAFRFWNFLQTFINAFIQGLQHLQAQACLGGVSAIWLSFLRLLQGGSESTFLFNLVMRAILYEVDIRFGPFKGIQIPLLHNFTHAVFADNYVCAAQSLQDLEQHFSALTVVLSECGLSWKLSSLCILCPKDLEPRTVTSGVHDDAYDLKMCHELVCLGVLLLWIPRSCSLSWTTPRGSTVPCSRCSARCAWATLDVNPDLWPSYTWAFNT